MSEKPLIFVTATEAEADALLKFGLNAAPYLENGWNPDQDDFFLDRYVVAVQPDALDGFAFPQMISNALCDVAKEIKVLTMAEILEEREKRRREKAMAETQVREPAPSIKEPPVEEPEPTLEPESITEPAPESEPEPEPPVKEAGKVEGNGQPEAPPNGSKRYTGVWNGLWHEEHYRKMGKAVFLFGFLLSRAKKVESASSPTGYVGIHTTCHATIKADMGITQSKLNKGISALKKGGYITIERGKNLRVVIHKFRAFRNGGHNAK